VKLGHAETQLHDQFNHRHPRYFTFSEKSYIKTQIWIYSTHSIGQFTHVSDLAKRKLKNSMAYKQQYENY